MIITNVQIADGSGTPLFRGSVEIEGSKISKVIKSDKVLTGKNIINGERKLLTPGFIDIHGHSDVSILAAPEAEGKITQGITTELCGNCGLSLFPLNDKNRTHISNLFSKYNVNITWNNIREYAAEISKVQPAVNIGSFCGHNTLRASTASYKPEIFSPDLTDSTAEKLDKELKAGAFGLSLGLLYVPGKFADLNEIVKLASVCTENQKLLTAHLRSEGAGIIEALNEYIDIALKAGADKLHISHLKTAGEKNFKKIQSVFNIIAENSEYLNITADRYPYTTSMTQLSAYMPNPYSDMNDSELILHLQNISNKNNFINKLKYEFSEKRWNTLFLISTNSEKFHSLIQSKGFDKQNVFGKSFSDIADILQTSPEIICSDILSDDATGTSAASNSMSYENMIKILKQPFVSCCTDESARPADFSLGSSHPRGFGAFPEFFRILAPISGIPETVRKMTFLPASTAGIKNRGLIAPGYFADLTLIDPKSISQENAKPILTEPHKKPSGILKVWVNGKLSYSHTKNHINRNGSFIFAD
jgi:N-acyl-D-amino-acid deacylase